MTLAQVKAAVMMLIDQYTPNAPPTDDEETKAKLNTMIELAQTQLCQLKKSERRCALLESQGEVDAQTGLVCWPLPADLYQVRRVMKGQNEVWAEMYDGRLTAQAGQGALELRYYAYPPEIDDGTPDETKLALDRDVLQALPYAVAADLLKADPSADYAAFEQKYMGLLANLDPRQSAGRLVVTQTIGRGL